MNAWSPESVWCVIPVYNNGGTVREVALRCCEQLDHVLVVDDGCTDVDVGALLADTDIQVLRHERNKGKGQALLSGLQVVSERGGDWMITVDADGQHRPEDIPLFFEAMKQSPDSIIIGARDFSGEHVPGGSKFGRKFSNFWIRLESGATVSDSQSGFRAYPVKLIAQMKLRGHYYDFEVEVLTKAVWHGLHLKDVPISVYYPPREERISHFDQWKDNVRLSGRHSLLVMRRLWPWPHRKLVKPDATEWKTLLRNPRLVLSMLLKENSTPVELATAAGVGLLLATLPLIACHTIAILYVSTKLNLNRLLAVNVQHICAPPVVPAMCIAVGFFMRHGRWLGMEELKNFVSDLHHHLLHWLLGSLVLAPLFAVLGGLLVYGIASRIQKKGAAQYA